MDHLLPLDTFRVVAIGIVRMAAVRRRTFKKNTGGLGGGAQSQSDAEAGLRKAVHPQA